MSILLRKCVSQIGKTSSVGLANIHTSAIIRAATDYYDVLRVPKTATQAEIKEAYYKLSKVYHPDVKKDESSLNMFRSITEAYDILGNVTAREEYDKEKFSSKELYDTTKIAFYQSLHRDSLQYGKFLAPDYEKILNKGTIRDEYLREEEKDRYLEVEIDRKKLWEHQYDAQGEFGQQRLVLVIAMLLLIKVPWLMAEDYFGWGLPDDYVEPWIYPTKY